MKIKYNYSADFRRQRGNIWFKGFSLIEILVVLSIISILFGLISSAGKFARRKAKIYQTQTMIASLETALSMYHTDFGQYPVPTGNPIKDLVNFLADVGTYSANPDWNGPYINFKKRDLNGVIPNAALHDPWGTDYSYASDGDTYTIISAGPDENLAATDDNITSQ
ncbi:MAG: hypothetical protein DRP78_05185 [Candidatus Omnitrophota bacterium]|nr:MAG: hypothetical protein DRP78_05185 [Candidatus Omnitrophota bacterium]